MNEAYVRKIKRMLTCHITSMTDEQAADLIKLIKERVNAHAAVTESSTPEPGSSGQGS